MAIRLHARRSGTPPERRDGRWILQTEREWLLEGPGPALLRVLEAYPEHTEPLAENLVLLNFRGAVGRYTLPGVGEVELISGKWSERHFNEMLRELTDIAAALPFAHRIGSGLPFERVLLPERPVPYHAFVYLQSILSQAAPSEDRLDFAVERILSEPQRRLAPEERLIPLEQARMVGVRGLLRVLQRPGEWVEATQVGGAMAAALGGHLPERVLDERSRYTVDTPENRFVRAALELAAEIAGATRKEIHTWRVGQRSHLLGECDRVSNILRRLRSHPMWREVGPMTYFPSTSTVLQRQYGYREVLRHFIRLRLLSRIPLDASDAKGLLELKDIPTLYELWVFFAVVRAVESFLGPPSEADAPNVSQGQLIAGHGLRVRWADGTQLLYNARYVRGGTLPSTSVPLRPDVSFFVPEGPNRGLHLFDAKFRLDSLAAFDGEDNAEASFKRVDLYKMHTYRDAIHEARSVWIVYPGSEYRFYPTEPKPFEAFEGVGAVPARPGQSRLPELLRDLRQPAIGSADRSMIRAAPMVRGRLSLRASR